MRNQSFRSIILVTLVIVVSSISFIAFRLYSHYLEKRIYSESERNTIATLTALELLKNKVYDSLDEHHGKVFENLLNRMENKDLVLNSYCFDAEGKLKYTLTGDSAGVVIESPEMLFATQEDVTIESFPAAKRPFNRTFIHLHNSPSCYECHPPEKKNLGFIVIDLSLTGADAKIDYVRRSSLLFTIVMVIIILAFVLFMHFRFVRRSLQEFNLTINAVNQGDLQKRMNVPETRELGRLGKNFNNMLDIFQKAQLELVEFHKKELRSNYKLSSIGEMAARLAHEIRNPITGIANAIEIIVRETDDKQNLPILEEIQRQANRVNDAITSLLKFSRKKELNLLMNNINEVITQVQFFLENQAHMKDIQFNCQLQDDIPHFRFDREQMEDAMLNLGINAIHAIAGSGSITFSTSYSPSDNQVCIHVTDTGKGIPEENLTSIFHPFFTTRNEGTGLGLAIVKDIIDKHDGIIWAENNKENGCTFTICLPADL